MSLKTGAPVLNPDVPDRPAAHLRGGVSKRSGFSGQAGRPALAEAIQQSVMVDLGCR